MEIYSPKEDREISEQEFRRMFPTTSFPATLTADVVKKYKHEPLTKDPVPEHDADLETVKPQIVATKDGFKKTYIVGAKPLSPAEKGNITKAKNAQKKQADLMSLKDAYRKHVYSVFDIEQIALIATLYPAMTADQMVKANTVIAWLKACLSYYLNQKKQIKSGIVFSDDFQQYPPPEISFKDLI